MLKQKGKIKVVEYDPPEIPKIFWKYYDSYRRGIIDFNNFAAKSGLSPTILKQCLSQIKLYADT